MHAQAAQHDMLDVLMAFDGRAVIWGGDGGHGGEGRRHVGGLDLHGLALQPLHRCMSPQDYTIC